MAAPPHVACAPQRPTTFTICLSSVSPNACMDLTGYAGCWGCSHIMRLNSNTRGCVVSVAIEFHDVATAPAAGVAGEVSRPRAGR